MKTNLDGLFKVDKGAEKDGVWMNINDTTGFLVRPFRNSNPRIKAALAAHYKPYARQLEIGGLDIPKQQEISIKLFLDVCLVDWRGVEIDGKDTPYSKEVALPFFKELPDLFDSLWKYAQDFNNYKEDLGNS